MKLSNCPNGSPCELKGRQICAHPDRPKKNRSKCVDYIPTPCDKCKLKGHPYGNMGKPESGVLVVSGSNYDTHIEDIMARIGGASADLALPISYYCTTAVKCVTDKKPSMALIRRCNSYLKKEIEIIKPKFVLVVGDTAFKALLWDFELVTRRKPEMDACAGSHIMKDGILYFVVHDLRSIKNDWVKNQRLKEHLKDFIKYVNGEKKVKPVHYKEVDSEKDLIYILEEAKKTGRVSIDIETDPLTAFLPASEILSISLTVKEGESFCIPLSWPTNKYFERWEFTPKINIFLAILYIKKIFSDLNIIKIFHNGAYDITWLEHIFDCIVKNYDDTMIMVFLMNQNDKDRKGLKFLTKTNLDMGYYEYQIKQYVGEGESYSNIPPRVLMHYNNCDTDATLRLWNLFRPKIKELHLEDIHYKFMIPNLRGIINLQKTGIAINKTLCVDMKYKEEEKLIELFSELRTLPQVAKFERTLGIEFKPSSPKHMFTMVYGGELTSSEEIPRKINPKTGKKVGKKEYEKISYNGFNLEPITVSAKNSVTGKREQRVSFGKKAIQKYLKGIFKDIEYLDAINTYNLDSLPSNTDIMKFIRLISEISSIGTQLSNHIVPFIDIWSKTTDGCVHTSYDITGTTTGRLACVAKGTMIEIVRDISKFPKGIPIERVNVGDLAYTYDDDNNLCLKKVKWAGRTGHKKCVKIKWKNTDGKNKKGELILTPEHKVRLVNKKWCKAYDLKFGDRILSLARVDNVGYSDLYGYSSQRLRDHVFVANECIGETKGLQVHHKDGIKLNNVPDNLQIMSMSEHQILHHKLSGTNLEDQLRRGEVNYTCGLKKSIKKNTYFSERVLANRPSKFRLLRMLALCAGRLLTVVKTYNYDFDTFKRYVESYSIDWREVRHRYGADKKYLSKGRVSKIVQKFKTIPKVAKELRIGSDLAKFLICRNNHIVVSVEQDVFYDVYNLEIEDTHKYIANELCTSNSRAPNLHNLKREGFVKRAFVSRWGDEGILLEFDYKQLELFVMAIVSQDPKFVYAFTHGLDLHTKTAANIVFHVLESLVTKQMRTNAKIINFGMMYLKTAFTLKEDLNVSEEEAQRIIDNFFTEYSGVKKYINTVINTARSKGYVTTVMGRRRYLDYSSDPNGADRQAVNTTIQSPASDVCLTAINQLERYHAQIAEDLTAKLVGKISDINQKERDEAALICGTVHDSIIIDCKKKHINEIVKSSVLIMEHTNLKWITIPLKVDVKYGHNLLDMKEYKEGETIEL